MTKKSKADVEPQKSTLLSEAMSEMEAHLSQTESTSASLPFNKPQDPVLRIPQEEPLDHRAAKFILEPHSQPEPPPHHIPAYADLGELPPSYGTRRLYLTARDPHFLYAYWDLNHDQLAEGERAAHDGKIFLQLYHANGSRQQQVQISSWSKEWYLHVDQADTTFYTEIGYYRKDGGFEVLSRSAQATTPRDTFSWKTDLQFVTIPFEFSFRELLEIIRNNMLEGEDLAVALARLQNEGFTFPFAVGRQVALADSTREDLLEYMGGGDIIRRVQAGSGEIIEIMRKSWQPAQSSGQWISSISSPFGSSFGSQPRDFFMHVNAELIIYGGTHPDAKVRINGGDIQLQPDGTFHYHFNFKDGKFHIPIEATSADGEETRAALISFLRLSAYTDGVDKTGQPDRNEPLGRVGE